MEREANARLIFWLRRVFGALRQIRIVKPTFGRPRYRFDVRHVWTLSAEQWVRPDLDKASWGVQEASGLVESEDLADESANLHHEREPGMLPSDGD